LEAVERAPFHELRSQSRGRDAFKAEQGEQLRRHRRLRGIITIIQNLCVVGGVGGSK